MTNTEQADIVVVGAGIFGTSVAYHLLERGAGNVIVLDAGTPASATSGGGAGFVGLWAAGYSDYFTDSDLALEQYGIDFYSGLPWTGALFDHRQDGNLFVATTDESWDTRIGPMGHHPRAPKDVRTLTPKEVNDVTGGVLAADAVTGGVLHPNGTQMSAGRATRALAARISAKGGQIRTHQSVTGLLVSGGKVTGVRTATGNLAARQVVLACGAWTNELLADVDVRIPLLRLVASRVISPPSGVSRSMPTVQIPELNALWLREHRGGFTYGNQDGYAPLFELDDSLGDPGQPRFKELVDRLDASLSPALGKLVPDHDTSIAWWLQGAPCMTPDRNFVAGSLPEVEGLYVFAGDNEAGVTHGPGLGRMLADLMVDGSSDWIDTSPYRPDRFKDGEFTTEQDVFAALPSRGWKVATGRVM